MMWDASAAYTNTEDGELNYAVAVSRFLHGYVLNRLIQYNVILNS